MSRTSPPTSKLGICVNPMAGRDVRRIAARASNVTHEAKSDMIARIAAGADSVGIEEIHIVREPFRIAERAVEWMGLRSKVCIHEIQLEHSLKDTAKTVEKFNSHDINHVVSLGGDGTQRIVARTNPNLFLIPVSTGTNNVYPLYIEPTFAGMVAAYGARGLLPAEELTRRSKVLHLTIDNNEQDIGLIDAARIENDFIGNYRPFKADNIKELVLTRAHPDSIGMSPIGGLVDPVTEEEDEGLYVRLGSGRRISVPVAPGHFRDVEIEDVRRISLGEEIQFKQSGLIELDGDRLHKIERGNPVTVSVRRDGPFVYDVTAAMTFIVREGVK